MGDVVNEVVCNDIDRLAANASTRVRSNCTSRKATLKKAQSAPVGPSAERGFLSQHALLKQLIGPRAAESQGSADAERFAQSDVQSALSAADAISNPELRDGDDPQTPPTLSPSSSASTERRAAKQTTIHREASAPRGDALKSVLAAKPAAVHSSEEMNELESQLGQGEAANAAAAARDIDRVDSGRATLKRPSEADALVRTLFKAPPRATRSHSGVEQARARFKAERKARGNAAAASSAIGRCGGGDRAASLAALRVWALIALAVLAVVLGVGAALAFVSSSGSRWGGTAPSVAPRVSASAREVERQSADASYSTEQADFAIYSSETDAVRPLPVRCKEARFACARAAVSMIPRRAQSPYTRCSKAHRGVHVLSFLSLFFFPLHSASAGIVLTR